MDADVRTTQGLRATSKDSSCYFPSFCSRASQLSSGSPSSPMPLFSLQPGSLNPPEWEWLPAGAPWESCSETWAAPRVDAAGVHKPDCSAGQTVPRKCCPAAGGSPPPSLSASGPPHGPHAAPRANPEKQEINKRDNGFGDCHMLCLGKLSHELKLFNFQVNSIQYT